VITDVPFVATARVVTVKVAVVDPAATVTEAGTVATEVVPEARFTVNPPAGAAELIVTVPVDAPAPVTVVGFKLSALTVGPVIAKEAVVLFPVSVAVIVAVALAPTAVVETLNVALVEPAGTVTEAGTVAAALFDASVTVVPPVGAALFNVTVAVEGLPPTTLVGLRVTLETSNGLIVKVAVLLAPPRVAVTVAVAAEPTRLVVTVNVPVVEPAATVTEAGTVAAALFDAKVIVVPPAGAALESVTVPVEFAMPPTTVVGLSAKPASAPGVTVNVAVAVLDPVAPVIVAEVLVATAEVVAVNVPVVAPAAIVIEAGTVTAALFDVRLTVRVSPVATGPLRVTVPVEEVPPATEVGFTVTVLI